jgi:hypothetical protein
MPLDMDPPNLPLDFGKNTHKSTRPVKPSANLQTNLKQVQIKNYKQNEEKP